MALRAFSSRIPAAHHLARVRWTQNQFIIPRSRFFSVKDVSSPSNLVQIYISRITDPYINLSIEHFLLQHSHPESVVLLLYTNRPCVVIGRNQNPWVEVNLGLANRRGILRELRAGADPATITNEAPAVKDAPNQTTPSKAEAESDPDDILLVRRRSGGGTVFHDAGNVNYSVICPAGIFDRDRHAEMVVRALKGRLRKKNVRVNERHDIVLDVASSSSSLSPSNNDEDGAPMTWVSVKPFKISGSAYKLTRARALHHGTCLLASPHLPFLGRLLRSPAAPYIKARGVESVRSPVRNIGVSSNAEFEDAVVAEFRAMYETPPPLPRELAAAQVQVQVQVQVLDDAAALVREIPELRAGVAELRSRDWIYAQTPQFAFSSHPTADDPRPRPDLPTDLPSSFFPAAAELGDPADAAAAAAAAHAPGLQMTVRHGQITEVAPPLGTDPESSAAKLTGNINLVDSLKGLCLHDIHDWRTHIGGENESVGLWLNRIFGVGE